MSMNKDLLLSLLETLAEQSKNANNTKMRQYNTANKILTIIQQGRFKELLIIPAPTQNQGQM